MGFFSQQCKHCEKSILSVYSINEINGWMMQAVVITPNGSVLIGTYDGYGRLDADGGAEVEDAIGFDNTVYHKDCWVSIGKPTAFAGPSPHAADQGYFFDDEEDGYNVPSPLGRSG